MDVLEDMNACFGCSACYSVCPTKSIKMETNEEGFLVPRIDEDTCIHCDRCKAVCPSLHPRFDNSETPKINAFAGDKALLKESSSGGAFTILAEKFLNEGGYVAGAAFDDSYDVHHIVISDLADLDKLRRSKYAPSNQEDCFATVKQLLADGKKVLYSGCPCQVAGLKNYLGKDYESLVTVDLLCHGSAPQHLFHEYLDQAYGLDRIADVETRRRDGWGTCVKVIFNNGTSVNHNSRRDNYLRAYLEDIILRRCCYGCPFSRVPRQGDITLGDFWAAKKLKLGKPYTKKSSLVLMNNEKGERCWNESVAASTRKLMLKDLSDEFTAEQLNKNVASATVDNWEGRAAFFANYQNEPFERAVLKTLYPYDVGMVLYVSNNFGSVATNFGLYKAVENLGYHPLVLDNLARNEGIGKNFVQRYLEHGTPYFDMDDYHSANVLFDSFIVGSDQSWRWDLRVTMKNLEYFLMSFAADGKRKIAYAASFGPERYNMEDSVRLFYTRMLSRFNAISVREDFAVPMCKKAFGANAVQQVDPVFLVPREDYIDLSKKSDLTFDQPFLFAYIRFPTPEKRQLIRDYARHFGIKAYVAVDANAYDKLTRAFNMEEVVELPQFVDWLAYYVNADYVITDSFHGTCFSLILQKRFIAFKGGTKTRFDSLANIVDGDEPNSCSGFLDSEDGLLGRTDGFRERDFDKIDERLAAARQTGLSWLQAALEADPEPPSATGDEVDFNVGFARLLKESLNSTKVSRRYGIDEDYRSRIDRKTKRGKTQIEAIRAVLDEDQPSGFAEKAKRKVKRALPDGKDGALGKIDVVEDYFDLARKGDYTLLMSCNDDCSKYWAQFVEASKLPLKETPAFHASYIAVVRGDKVVYEETSKSYVRLRRRLPLGKKLFGTAESPYVYLASKGFDKGKRNERSIIMVNNVDYAVDKRGLNVVTINNRTGEVVDTFYVDLHVGMLMRRTR